jgi:hypothetical protein
MLPPSSPTIHVQYVLGTVYIFFKFKSLVGSPISVSPRTWWVEKRRISVSEPRWTSKRRFLHSPGCACKLKKMCSNFCLVVGKSIGDPSWWMGHKYLLSLKTFPLLLPNISPAAQCTPYLYLPGMCFRMHSAHAHISWSLVSSVCPSTLLSSLPRFSTSTSSPRTSHLALCYHTVLYLVPYWLYFTGSLLHSIALSYPAS